MTKKLFVLLICLAMSATTLAGIVANECGGGCCKTPVEATLTSGDGHSCCCCAGQDADLASGCAPSRYDGDLDEATVDNQRSDDSRIKISTTVATLATVDNGDQFECFIATGDPPSPPQRLAILQRFDC